ncbi:MAG: TPM domain-containing protein [Methanothrix sp.]|nr:TPM domain-containing protein [Methanothrix sp.]
MNSASKWIASDISRGLAGGGLKWFIFLFACFFLFVTPSFAVQPALPQQPLNHVVDLAGIIDDGSEAQLDGYLTELEQKTTAQFIVLTVTSLEGESLEDFSLATAHDKWKLGQKGKDNGILLVVALNDKKYRFETGYGLEGILPDSLTGSIGREYLVPNFRKGDYSTGITAAALAVANVIASANGVEITGMPKLQVRTYSDRSQRGGGLAGKVLTLLFFICAVILFIRYPRLFLLLLFASSMGGGRRDGWGGGGGFGGGGSFGGGGGGGFGGGGSSGGW